MKLAQFEILDRFNVSIETASRIISKVIYFISRMPNIYIKWHNDEEKRLTSE
uniref:DN38978_c0_g1_i1 n=1 Tax=Ceratitis capitata TaxID=7213 RepID=A0A6B7K2X0_CERCA|nr:DN38978_c0_g1_i1 [Ceratitis capitata]